MVMWSAHGADNEWAMYGMDMVTWLQWEIGNVRALRRM